MAKAKSKKITIEEALVLVDEQPYQIPENWCWTYLKAGFDVTSSKRVHKSDWIDEGIPFYRTRELVKLSENGEVDNELFISEELYEGLINEYGKPEIDDILISGVGTIGIPYVVNSNEKFYFKDGNVIWLKNKSLFDAKYVFYLYKSLFIINQIHDMSAGTTVDTYTIVNANMTKIPLPPLAEQQRIVDRIENLFSELDEAKEKTQEVIESIDTNIEAVLFKAFDGQLTTEWRKYNDITDDWDNTTLSKIVSGIKYGLSEKSDYDNKGTPVLRIPNIGDGIIDFSDLKFMSSKLDNSSHEVVEDDILIIRSNGSRDLVGKCALVPKLEKKYAYASFLIRIKASEKVLPEYLVRFMNSSKARMQLFTKAKSSSGIHNINSKELGAINIKIPSLIEQEQILKLVGELVDKVKMAKEVTIMTIESIDEMKKSILAKAFRGELGTNNPDEESSIKLLKQIIEQR